MNLDICEYFWYCDYFYRHADVMKKIIQMVADGGGDLGVHVYPLSVCVCEILRKVVDIFTKYVTILKILQHCEF